MTPVVLAGAYFLVGVVCATLELRRSEGRGASELASALVTFLLWPLWAPFSLGARERPRRRSRTATRSPFRALFALFRPATVSSVSGEERGLMPRRPVLRVVALLFGLALLPAVLVATVVVLSLHLFWSALGCVGMLLFADGCVAWFFRVRCARAIVLAGLSFIVGPVLLRVVLSRGADGIRLTTLPGDGGTRLVNTLFPERDGCLLAAGMLGKLGALNDEESGHFHAILESAYARIGTSSLRLPTPAIATYLGLETPSAFDGIVIAPPPAENARAATGAVLFLHGYAGNFYVYCWELSRAAGAANLLTVCPSLDASGAWWTPRGDETLRETLGFLRSQGIVRVYLAGLSNGAAGASVLAQRHERELSGLILISGVRAERPPALPVLVIQGSRDRMMPAPYARAYAAQSARVRYHEVQGGHLVFLSKHELIRPEIAAFLRSEERGR